MIQEIFPKHLNNQYADIKPKCEDFVLLFEGSSLLAKQTVDETQYLTYGEFEKIIQKSVVSIEEAYDIIYLLSVDEERFFLAMPKNVLVRGEFKGEMADSAVHGEYQTMFDGYEYIGVNMFRQAKPRYRAFAAITGYHLYCWYRDNRYCGRCGHELVHDDNERMMKCPYCSNTIYPKISPAVIVGITNGTKLLLTKYVGKTYRNYALVAGFAEIGETLEETVAREVMEEVGLKVKNIRYYKSQPWALSGSLLSGFYCELDGDDTITLQEDELSIGEWVEASDIQEVDDGISLTREMILKFKRDTLGI